jgi:undecaprenyl-diphosphatase
LTEFVPVSSTAHLLVTQLLLGWHFPEQEAFIFDVLVQWGTLLALVIYFRLELVELVRSSLKYFQRREATYRQKAFLSYYLVLSTIPAVIAGLVFKDTVQDLFRNQALAASVRLTVSAILLIAAELVSKRSRGLSELNWKDALWIGCFQVLAVFPGSSRSGSTISGGMIRHLGRSDAARFAFLMSIPVMLAAGLVELVDLVQIPNLFDLLPPFLTGFITAAIIGYLAIRWLLAYLSKRSLYLFAVYCLALAIFIVLFQLL